MTVARKLKSAAAKQVKVDWETAQERAAADVWLSARPELAAVLALGDDRGKRQQVILQQLAWKAQRGPLSDAQVDLAFKLADQLATEPQPAEIAAGRREITGKLVAIKESFGAYGSSLRATVVHVEDGKKAVFNGTLPRSLYAAKVGDEVSMTATVEPRDEGFAFFKRPTKAVVVGGEEPDTCSACGDSEVYLLAHPTKDVMICEECHDNVMDDAYENGYA